MNAKRQALKDITEELSKFFGEENKRLNANSDIGYIENYCVTSSYLRRYAIDELIKMAKAADMYNEMIKENEQS